MSDYVHNPDYSMQLAAPEDDPASYDWTRLKEEVDQAMPNPFADITLASLQEDTNVEAMDWSELNAALENGPWHDIFRWERNDDQGAQSQPGDWAQSAPHCSVHDKVDKLPSATSESAGRMSDVLVPKPEHVCTVHGCKSKPFRRRTELQRHSLKHGEHRWFPCPALDCRFVGKKAFTRANKLNEHILAGHDEDTVFICSHRSCGPKLTRDLLVVHNFRFASLEKFRKCPLPKCGYKANLARNSLDEIQVHLAKKHDPQGRSQFAHLLLSRGYDHASLDIVCPLCVSARFKHHSAFYKHILDCHVSDIIPDGDDYDFATREIGQLSLGHPGFSMEKYKKTWVEDLHQHRRTVLSLWPAFVEHDIWEDIGKHNRH